MQPTQSAGTLGVIFDQPTVHPAVRLFVRISVCAY